MPRLSRGVLLQDFAREGEDLLDTLLTSAQRQPVLPAGSSDGQHSRQYRSAYTGHGGMPALSEEASSGSGRSADNVHVDIASLQHYKNRIGPELRQMRQAQGRNREYYTLDHLRRLKQFEAQASYNEGKCSEYCKDYHVQPCRACTTCHFCRQKTIDEKTYCPCYNSTKRVVGGKGRGFWCGSCLYIRMGENIHEVKHRSDWRCPCCRDICNCSGANCLRARRNLAVTNQLIHEATKQGFKSVAHYLILTHLSEQGGAMPMMDITNMRKRTRPEEEDQLVDNPVFKQARLAYDISQEARQRAGARFHETAAQQIRKQLQLLKAELPLPPENDSNLAFMAAAGFGSHVLEDDQDDDGDQPSSGASPASTGHQGSIGTAEGQPPQQHGNSVPSGTSWRNFSPGALPEADRPGSARSARLPGEARREGPAIHQQDHFRTQDGMQVPGTSFAAFAWGLARPAVSSASRGAAQSHTAASSMAASTNSGTHAYAMPDTETGSIAVSLSGPMSAHMAESTIIDSISPWDGPHPGLAAGHASVGSAHQVRRAPIGIVRLPASLLAPRRRGLRPPRPPRGADGGSSRQPVSDTHRLGAQSDVHNSQTGPLSASVGPDASPRDPVMSGSHSMCANLGESSHHHRQQQQQQHSDIIDMTEQTENGRGLSQSGSQEEASGSLSQQGHRPIQTTEPAAVATTATALRSSAETAGDTAAGAGPLVGRHGPQGEHAHEAERSAARGRVTKEGPAEDRMQEQQQHSGMYGDFPDKPGHLATVEQCRLANGGVCWHLLQMAVRARQFVQKGRDAKMHEAYSELVKGLLEKLTLDHTTSVSITALAFNPAPADTEAGSPGTPIPHLKSHADLRYAIALLLLAAEALPEQDVEFTVCRLLFNQEPFVDFMKSDLQARAMLIKASFDLFTVMQRRTIQVEGVCRGIMHMLGSLTHEYAELLTRVAVKQEPLEMGQELHVGPFHMPAAMSLEEMNDQLALLISLTMGNEGLLKVFLQYVQRCCSSSSPQTAVHLLGPELADLLHGGRVVRPEVRHGALSAIYAAMTAAMQAEESGQAAGDTGSLRLLAEHVQATLMQPVEQLLLVDYPLRSPPAADADDPGIAFKLDEVSVSLKVEVLARAYALLAQSGLMGWSRIEMSAMKPFHPRTFWKHANTLYRHFAVFFLAHTLQANHRIAAFTAVAVELLSMWLRTALDDGKRNALKYFTLVVASNQHTRALFRHVTHTQQALLADQTGVVRASIVLAVLKEAAVHPQWRSHVVDLMNDLDDILAARGREVSAVPAHQFEWERAATNICAAITQAAGHLLAAHKTGTSGASLLSLLLKRMAGWMASAASYLQRCHQVAQEGSVSAAYMEGLNPSHELNSIAQARQALQGSPLAHMRTVFLSIIKTCTNQVGQQLPSQTLASQPPWLRPLHTLITACLEIPTAALSATSVDVALYETLADALAPAGGRTSAEGEQQRAGDGSGPIWPVAVPSRDGEQLQWQLLHLVLGTYVRRYLCRSSFGHVIHQRPAVNAVRFLERLFTQPSLRGGEGSLRALLPPLLGPILEAFCPVEPGLQRMPSLPTKHALYTFLQGLFTDNPTLVPPVDTPAPLSSTHFQNGPLQTGSHVDLDRFQVAMHAFLEAVCSDVLACVWKLCAPAGMPAVQLPDQPSHSQDLHPLTQQGCSSACGTLFSVLGPPRSLAGVQALYSAHNTAQGGTTAGSGVCWPADFPWRLAEAGLAFLAALGSLGCHGKHWLRAACPSMRQAMLHSPAHSRPLRPAYQKLLEVLQTQNVSTLQFDLPQPAPVGSHHQNSCYQPPQQQQQQLHQQQACHQQQAPLQQPHVGLSSSSSLLPQQGVAAAAVVVKTEGEAVVPRQQVYAHDVPFESIARLQPGDLLGLTGWLRRPPSTKMRKNGDSVLLLDLEDERGASIRLICLGPIRERAQSVVSSQQDAQPELPVILSLTNVAVSKQKALLHATQASQVHPGGNGTAASRIRQHALHTLARSRLQTGQQADQSAAMQADDVSQLLMSATQQSVAVSSQRTAQYHWGPTQQALTQPGQQTAGPTTDAASHAQLPGTAQKAQILAYATQMHDREGVQSAVSSGLIQQPQLHRKAAYADLEKQQLPPTAVGMTASDIAQTVSQLCEVSNTDRGTAMAALRRAIQENMRGKDAITNRAAEILLS